MFKLFQTEKEYNFKTIYCFVKSILKDEEEGENLYAMLRETIEIIEKAYPKLKEAYKQVELNEVIRKFEIMK